MKIKSNDYEGKYAVPLTHSITCFNPAPWKITEMSIEMRNELIVGKGLAQVSVVMIRCGDKETESCWFRADQCFCGTKEDCEDYITIRSNRSK